MKNIIKMVRIIAIAAVIGFTFGACDNGGGNENNTDAFAGTWVSEDAGGMKISAGNGSWTLSQGYGNNWIDYVKGTYTVSGNTVNITTTHGNTNESGGVTWTAYASLSAWMKENIPQNMTGTLNGNTFTANGADFTKQTSGGGGGGGTGGTFTLTDIPAHYNGLYAELEAYNEAEDFNTWIKGYQAPNGVSGGYTRVQITDGSVSLSLWKMNGTRYTGSDTFSACQVAIYSSAYYNGISGPGPVTYLDFDPSTFSNGSLTKSWNDNTGINK